MNKPKILIVEDEGLTAFAIQQKLKKWGYDVPNFTVSGKDAIKKALSIEPDLIILDINLKGKLNGLETAEKILGIQDVPIIFTTAYDDEKISKRAYEIGAADYIIKPYEDYELKVKIQNILQDSFEEEDSINFTEDNSSEVLINEHDLKTAESIENTQLKKSESEINEEIIEELSVLNSADFSEEKATESFNVKEDKLIECLEDKSINIIEINHLSTEIGNILSNVEKRFNIFESFIVLENGSLIYSNTDIDKSSLNTVFSMISTARDIFNSQNDVLKQFFLIGEKIQTLIIVSSDISLIFSLDALENIGMVSITMKNVLNELNILIETNSGLLKNYSPDFNKTNVNTSESIEKVL